MSTIISLLVFLHVLAAATWIGAFIMHMQFMHLTARSETPEERVKLFAYDDRLSNTLYIPASLTVVIAGLALVLLEGISFGEPWIAIGIAVWLFAFLIGIGFYVPQGKRLEAAVEAHGAASAQAQGIIDRVLRFQRVDLLLLIFVVFAMTTRLAF
jgi:uncharacterized membrane protein